MSPSDLQEMIDDEPFRPLRLTMSSGDRFLVQSPRHVFVTGTSVYLGVLPDPETGIPRRGKILSLVNLASVERVDEPLPPARGRSRRRPRP